jgi:phosphoribosyl 1,2-cyclic phosphodiesterase
MKLWVLGSGSRGNAVVVESGDCRVLIDVGFGPRILERRMRSVGIEPESIEACIITHEHSDHLRGARRAVRRWNWELFATEGTYRNSRLSILQTRTTTFRAGATLTFSDLEVATFKTPHDAEEPIGVVVTSKSTGARAAVCTDIGYASRNVRQLVSDVDLLVLESNHDEQMLANGPYPPWLQRRIASNTGHLSNRHCGLLVRDSVTPRLRQIVLAHLSEKNNTALVAYENMRAAVKGTRFRGALIPALQDAVVGPFMPAGGRAQQLSLGL